MTEETTQATTAAVEQRRGPHDVPVRAMTFEERIAYAEKLSYASLLPSQYRQAPANVLVAMEFGDALGIPPIQAINSIHVIDGKPSASADLLGALIRRAGHKLRVTSDDRRAVAQIIRWDDPDFTFESEWTIEKARQAGLLGKRGGNWEKYPAAMLRARAITEVARAAASDALYGVRYTPEELGAAVNEEGTPLEYVSTESPSTARPAPEPSAPPTTADRPEEAREDVAPESGPEKAAEAGPEVVDAEVVDEASSPEEAPASPEGEETPSQAAIRLAAANRPQDAIRAAWSSPEALRALDEWIKKNKPEASGFRDLIAARLNQKKEQS